ncbi:unnamed protein product [Onchocerca flexuosa]|uniref:DNA ligase (ATP) n=1 Tax=Onchocerca flexuosa TaxID=387005 RepID=A0A183H8P1_9BILA|nr:unnamed protein product [Onchocerca flexuosa]
MAICRLFDVKEEEINDLSEFLKSCLYNHVAVTKQANNDILLTVIDDDDDIDEFENLSFIDIPTQKSLPSESFVVKNGTFSPNQYRNESQDRPIDPTTSANVGTTAKSSLPDSEFARLTANDRFEYWKGSTLASAKIRSKDDCLPYKVLGDKILSFVRAKGSLKVSDLSEIFFEEDGRYIDPKNYKEGTWENIIKKLLSAGGHPELVVRDGILDLDRKDFQKFVSPPTYSSNNSDNTKNENGRSASLTVPAVIIYDLLMESGRPLLLKELVEKLSSKGIKVNACQLTVKLITEFKDFFCCEFHSTGTLISLLHGAKRPEEPAKSSCLSSFTESVKIVTHVMSDYCSTIESPSNIFKPVSFFWIYTSFLYDMQFEKPVSK